MKQAGNDIESNEIGMIFEVLKTNTALIELNLRGKQFKYYSAGLA